MQAVILAGGKGTRLAGVLGDRPKALMDIDGVPLLLRQIGLARRHGIANLLALTGYGSRAIEDAVQGLGVTCVNEGSEKPLGTAGALLAAHEYLEERFFVFYADCMMNVDLTRMLARHREEGADATLFVHPNDHPADSDLIETDARGWIQRKPAGKWRRNLVNAALHVFEKGALAEVAAGWDGEKLDIGKQLFPAMLAGGKRLFGYQSGEYIKDAGTPDRYAKVLADVRSGRVDRMARDVPQRAIFLDRDGTINAEVERVRTPDDFDLLPGAGQAVRLINRSEYRAVVVTNQAVIARGDCDEATLAQVHAKMETLLGDDGAYLDGIYYCPHHPETGFAGEVAAFKIACDCRKPATGMLGRAARDFHIEMAGSWLIGDSTLDVRTARNAGVRPVLVRTGKGGRDGQYPDEPDYTFDTLLDAVRFLVGATG